MTIIFKQMIKYSHFRSPKINIHVFKHCIGRKVVHFPYTFQSAKVFDLIRNKTWEASLFSNAEDFSKITGINTAINRAELHDQHIDWNFLLQS